MWAYANKGYLTEDVRGSDCEYCLGQNFWEIKDSIEVSLADYTRNKTFKKDLDSSCVCGT